MEAEVIVEVVGYTMAGVWPIVCPIDLCHFVHGLFARAARQFVFTTSGKLSVADGLCEGAEKSDAILLVEPVEELVVVEVDALEELGPACPSPIELGIRGWCSGVFSGISSSREFIHEVIVGGRGYILKFLGACWEK